ncbi:hypothetical protein GB931_11995 [Modestobacter sp. I12A-02628]|uniref:Uncharacterized protein n=1 Tax=Goekera deserti TaxID=2497753 RepID=A0A7K3W8Y3_9ACTN|nr:hypothetical protein [Goekera deserti]MPQ98628.1 hypothetical protein [Goekera deserti]NDI49190.1 hypothetical protein [Goekera deserti]NEL52928.1 hypothetical protein [Goekera deserti]
MSVLVVLVPALAVVLVGYVVGYGVALWVSGLLGAPLSPAAAELVGWATGLALLGVVSTLLGRRWLRRRDRLRVERGHQK